MTRSAASRAAAAADALLDWLGTQPPAATTDAVAADHGSAAGTGAADPGSAPTRARPRVRNRAVGGAPLRLPHPDWLRHRLTIAGPPEALGAFRATAAGAGVIPWQLDLDRMAEDFFLLLVAPPPPRQRTLSLAGARILAGQLRDSVAHRYEFAVARVGRSLACPFDLHALIPVPDEILRLGPDDPASETWLWENWGTTQPLRHVAEDTGAASHGRRRAEVRPFVPDQAAFRLEFWSADWTPWRAFMQLAERWPTLSFDARPDYEAA